MHHHIHIPVMGICYTADTPVRVAHMGLTSVISLVDDGLLEEYRMAYGERLGMDVGEPEKSREGRIRAYLDFVKVAVQNKFDWIQELRLGGPDDITEKDRYFLMLPPDSPLRQEYEQVVSLSGMSRISAEVSLTHKMEMGDIQANIMVSLNHRDAAIDAVRGFAKSKVNGSLVLSAGVNLGVFEELAKFKCFYRTDGKAPQKRIIIKVSDYRSALVQGRYLAKKGLEVYEYRIESGVNCGGHAFFEGGQLLPDVLQEFVSRRQELFESTNRLIARVARSRGEGEFSIEVPERPARITAQGGLCTAEEVQQVLDMGADGVGVGTPFLLVPQVTSCDAETRKKLAAATPLDIYVSHASPLGVPFMNLGTSTAAELVRIKQKLYLEQSNIQSEATDTSAGDAATDAAASAMMEDRVAQATSVDERVAQATANLKVSADLKPGFPCLQHYLCREVPGFDHPVCMSSREYVSFRLAEIDAQERSGDLTHAEAENQRKITLERECICRFLGNAGRNEIKAKRPTHHYERDEVAAARGKEFPKPEPVTICPSPSIAYFDREYTLLEMMQHLYGTGPRLAAAKKPHAFEIEAKMMENAK